MFSSSMRYLCSLIHSGSIHHPTERYVTLRSDVLLNQQHSGTHIFHLDKALSAVTTVVGTIFHFLFSGTGIGMYIMCARIVLSTLVERTQNKYHNYQPKAPPTPPASLLEYGHSTENATCVYHTRPTAHGVVIQEGGILLFLLEWSANGHAFLPSSP